MELNLEEFLRAGALIGLPEKKILLAWGECSWEERQKLHKAPLFYFPDFFLQNPKPWCHYPYWAIVSYRDLRSRLEAIRPKNALLQPSWQPVAWELFEQTFAQFQTSSLIKAVPFVEQRAPFSYTKNHLIQSLLSAVKTAEKFPMHIYGFWQGSDSGLLGVTPEKLFWLQDKGKTLVTVACAGTNAQKALLVQDSKCLEEHAIVVRDIIEQLLPYGIVKRAPRSVRSFGHLSHFITPIVLQAASPLSIAEAITALHPTPAHGAYPRADGKLWLAQIEKLQERSHFGAPVGCKLPDGTSVCLVAIRAAEWTKETLAMKAGCGITKQSILSEEKNELCLKLSSIKKMLNL
jgi:menaquinone-specific isochorismate synthase